MTTLFLNLIFANDFISFITSKPILNNTSFVPFLSKPFSFLFSYIIVFYCNLLGILQGKLF
jgi:hypothetical protein